MHIVLLDKSSDQNVTAKKQQGACPKRSHDLWGIPRDVQDVNMVNTMKHHCLAWKWNIYGMINYHGKKYSNYAILKLFLYMNR